MLYPTVCHPSRHVWDFWYHYDQKNQIFHLFYLNAEKSYFESDNHHYVSRVGHGITRDFTNIEWLDDSVLVANKNKWYSTSIWSGDVIEVADGFLMFFTSRDDRNQEPETQMIGVAFAPSLDSPWEVVDDFQLKAEPDLLDVGLSRSQAISAPLQAELSGLYADLYSHAAEDIYERRRRFQDLTTHAWRDPFLFRVGDAVFMLISAKSRQLPLGQNGCVGLVQLWSDGKSDPCRTLSWRTLHCMPVSQPGFYAEMEVPQIYCNSQGQYELVFSSWAKYDFAPTTQKSGGLHGITSSRALDFHHSAPHVLMPETAGLYACRVIPELGGEIVGFDIQTGGIRRSGVKTHFRHANGGYRNFADLSLPLRW